MDGTAIAWAVLGMLDTFYNDGTKLTVIETDQLVQQGCNASESTARSSRSPVVTS